MKKLILFLSVIILLSGCASKPDTNDNDTGNVAQNNIQGDSGSIGESRNIIDDSQDTADDAFRRGIIALRADNNELAITEFSTAIRLNNNYTLAYLNRGTAYANKGDYDTGIQDFNTAQRMESDFEVIYYNRGVTYHESGDYDKAIEDYNEAIRLDPNYAIAYNNRGNSYFAKGEYNLAIADYEAALNIDPSLSSARSNIEAARNELGN